jgi:PilZ domain-containing protein
MTEIAHPTQGDGVSILAPHNARLRGRIAARDNGSLTVELEETSIRRPFHFGPGAQVALEWIDPRGVFQVTARVDTALDDPLPVLELELIGEPEPVERRETDRANVELQISAWTLAQPTRRLAGNTVNVSARGALVSLPDLAPFAATLELQIALPGGAVHASTSIRWRGEPALVGVEFERISPEQLAQLVEFLRELSPG